jgi:hypothetical protein
MSKPFRKHQATMPARVLREASSRPGDDVVMRAAGPGRLEAERCEDLVERFAGSLPAGSYPPGHLDDLRAEWRT